MRLEIPQNRIFRRVITVTDEDTEEDYRLKNEEKIIFGVKKVPGKRNPYVIKKELAEADYDESTGGYILTLTSRDTDLPPGLYFCDAALKKADGEFEPIIGKTEFEILSSVVSADE